MMRLPCIACPVKAAVEMYSTAAMLKRDHKGCHEVSQPVQELATHCRVHLDNLAWLREVHAARQGGALERTLRRENCRP